MWSVGIRQYTDRDVTLMCSQGLRSPVIQPIVNTSAGGPEKLEDWELLLYPIFCIFPVESQVLGDAWSVLSTGVQGSRSLDVWAQGTASEGVSVSERVRSIALPVTLSVTCTVIRVDCGLSGSASRSS